MRKIRTILLPCWLLCLSVAGVAQTPPAAPLPIPRDAQGKVTPVGDFANVIDDATEQKLANILKNLADKQGIEYAVVTVKTLDGKAPVDYATELMRGWGVGSEEKDGQAARPGLLTLVAIDDRKYFTEPSRHLEGDLPDGVVGQIQRDNLVPLLKQNRYSEAIFGTAQAFIGEMASKRGFTVEGLDQKYMRRTTPGTRTDPARSIGEGLSLRTICCCLGALGLVLLVLFLISRRSGGGGSGWGGGGFGGGGSGRRGGGIIPIPIILGGGWGGGDSGGSSGGSDWGSSDWGGFSGGGGDAGGGGAGGDW